MLFFCIYLHKNYNFIFQILVFMITNILSCQSEFVL